MVQAERQTVRMIRLAILILAMAPLAIAESPAVQMTNLSRPAAADFKIGDRFEITIKAEARQPVSVRTTATNGHTDWGPVVGWTDAAGRWSTTGEFRKSDFGDSRQVWTIGGKPADPILQVSIDAPCVPGGEAMAIFTGMHHALHCPTTEGMQTFQTLSDTDDFRTPDGRTIPPHSQSDMTADQYHAEIIQSFIGTGPSDRPGAWLHGDRTAAMILEIIGVNALTNNEIRNVLRIVRAAFQTPANEHEKTLQLLRTLARSTDTANLKQLIAETEAWVYTR